MKIEVVVKTDSFNREVWVFSFFCKKLVLNTYKIDVRLPKKRKWKTVNIWSAYSDVVLNFSENNKLKEPKIPEHIKTEAIKELNKNISCLNWFEYKN